MKLKCLARMHASCVFALSTVRGPGFDRGSLDAIVQTRIVQLQQGHMPMLQIADVEMARAARGLRLVMLTDAPSPWSQAAKAIFELKQIPGLLVRMPVRDR